MRVEQRVKYCPFCGDPLSVISRWELGCRDCNLKVELEDEYGDSELTKYPQLDLFKLEESKA